MLQLGWWLSWRTSILLNDACRRCEALDRIGGKARNREEKIFGKIYINSVILGRTGTQFR